MLPPESALLPEEVFAILVLKIKEEESEVARLAIQHFGSVEKYTKAMKYNPEHFSTTPMIRKSSK